MIPIVFVCVCVCVCVYLHLYAFGHRLPPMVDILGINYMYHEDVQCEIFLKSDYRKGVYTGGNLLKSFFHRTSSVYCVLP